MTLKEYIPFYKRNLKVAIPIVLSQVGGAVVQVVDSIMVGRLGTVPLAAVSFASSVFLLFFAFGNGLLIGVTPLVGELVAKNDKRAMSHIFQNQFVLAIASSLVLLCAMLAARHVLQYMGQEQAVVQEALPYFTIIAWSILPNALFLAFKQFFEGLGNTLVAMIITLISNVINVVLNYLFIFGKFGCPAMGVAGAALATFIARAAMPILFLIWTFMRRDWREFYHYFSFNAFSAKILVKIFSIGLPIAIQILLEMLAFSISAVMMGWLGAASLAAHQIACNVTNLFFMVVLGVSQATTVRVSHQYGARSIVDMRAAANASIHLCLVANFIMGTSLIIFREQVAMIFSSDPEVIRIAKIVLVLGGVFQLSDGMQAVGAGILRGLKDVKITSQIALVAYILLNLPIGYLLAFQFDLKAAGIWIGFIFGLTIAAILYRIRYIKDFKNIECEFAEKKE